MRAIIITGATSFVGRNLIDKINNDKYKVYALIRENSVNKTLLKYSKNLEIVETNMSDYYKLDKIISADDSVFVHLAWEGTRGNSRMDESLQKQNYRYSLDILKAAMNIGCSKFITSGSQAEYGTVNHSTSESESCHPNTEYGKWKLRFYEEAFSICNKSDIRFLEARFFSLYGSDDFKDTLIMSTLNKMLKDEDCPLTECKQIWDFLYIEDAVDGLLRLIELDCAEGAYNFGNGNCKPLKSFIEDMARITNSKSRLLYGAIPYPQNGMVSLSPIIEKLKKETNWSPHITFEEGISRILGTLN